MKHLYITLLALCLVLTGLRAQITIVSSSMPGSGDTIRYSSAWLSSLGNYTATGANHTWHFDTLRPLSQGVRAFKAALLTPYAFYFASPNKYGEKVTDSIGVATFQFKNIYSFYKKTSTVFSAEGIGFTFSGIPLAGLYSNEDELYQFPLDYLDRDSSTFKFKVTLPSVGFYGKQGYRINEVDGWGTITTPFGTAPCLRVISTQYSTDSIGTPLGNFGFPNVQRSYQWLVTSQKIPYLDITGNLIGNGFTPTQARYRDSVRYIDPNPFGVSVAELNQTLALNFYPNPASDQLHLDLPAVSGTIRADIYDLTGRLVSAQTLESCTQALNHRSLDLSSLPGGQYLLRLQTAGASQSLKFSKQ